MSALTDFSLEPLQLEDEFEAEAQEEEHASTAGQHQLEDHDELRLKADPHLARFFDTIEGHHLPMREVLLLSCHAHQRVVDEALQRESKRPVVQGRRKPTADAAAVAAAAVSPSPEALSSPSSSGSHSTSPPASKVASAWSKWFKKQNKNASQPSSLLSPSPSPSNESPQPAMSPSRGGSALPVSHQTATAQERAARAPIAAEPQPCTIVLSNLALYIFPPAIAIDMGPKPASSSSHDSSSAPAASSSPSVQYFLVYNEYKRIALQDLLLVSLPYRMGLTRHGTDFALRITDFALHLRDGETTTWLQAPKNKRSRIVESVSDAWENLMGLSLEMQQVDYSELIDSILTRQVWTTIHDLQIHRWATIKYLTSGWLYHRSVHVWPSVVSPNEEATASEQPIPGIELKMAPPSEWKRKWFVLSQDNYLLQFNSPQELEAFQFVATSSSNSSALKFPASLCNQIDLNKSLYLRGASTRPDAFEIVVYPRSSSMHVTTAAEHEEEDADRPDPALLALGYTRNLFQIPMPQTDLPTLVTSPPPARAASDATAAAATTRSPALTAFCELEVNRWLTALRSAMQGPGLSPTSLLTPAQPTAGGDSNFSSEGDAFGRQTPVALRLRSKSLAPLDQSISASPEPLSEDYAQSEPNSPRWSGREFLAEQPSPPGEAYVSPQGPDTSASPMNLPKPGTYRSPQRSPEPAPMLP